MRRATSARNSHSGYVEVGELQIAGDVLDQDLPAQKILRAADIGADDIERLLGIGQRQQIVQMASADRAPAQMIGHQRRLEALDQRLELRQMRVAQAIGRTQRQPYAMQAQRIVARARAPGSAAAARRGRSSSRCGPPASRYRAGSRESRDSAARAARCRRGAAASAWAGGRPALSIPGSSRLAGVVHAWPTRRPWLLVMRRLAN